MWAEEGATFREEQDVIEQLVGLRRRLQERQQHSGLHTRTPSQTQSFKGRTKHRLPSSPLSTDRSNRGRTQIRSIGQSGSEVLTSCMWTKLRMHLVMRKVVEESRPVLISSCSQQHSAESLCERG